MKNLEDIAIDRVGKLLEGDTFVHEDIVSCTLGDAENCYVAGYIDATDKAAKWIQENLTYIHPRKGTEECIVNINRFKEYMKEE